MKKTKKIDMVIIIDSLIEELELSKHPLKFKIIIKLKEAKMWLASK